MIVDDDADVRPLHLRGRSIAVDDAAGGTAHDHTEIELVDRLTENGSHLVLGRHLWTFDDDVPFCSPPAETDPDRDTDSEAEEGEQDRDQLSSGGPPVALGTGLSLSGYGCVGDQPLTM